MQIGDKVRHVKTGHIMTVKKINQSGNIITTEIDEEIHAHYPRGTFKPTYICSKSNLIRL